jgi:hypothetical protein
MSEQAIILLFGAGLAFAAATARRISLKRYGRVAGPQG